MASACSSASAAAQPCATPHTLNINGSVATTSLGDFPMNIRDIRSGRVDRTATLVTLP